MDFPYSYVSLPEGTPLVLEHGYGKKPLFRQIIERITWAIFVASLAILPEGSDSGIELCFRTTEVSPVSNLKIMSCFVSPTFPLLFFMTQNTKNPDMEMFCTSAPRLSHAPFHPGHLETETQRSRRRPKEMRICCWRLLRSTCAKYAWHCQ